MLKNAAQKLLRQPTELGLGCGLAAWSEMPNQRRQKCRYCRRGYLMRDAGPLRCVLNQSSTVQPLLHLLRRRGCLLTGCPLVDMPRHTVLAKTIEQTANAPGMLLQSLHQRGRNAGLLGLLTLAELPGQAADLVQNAHRFQLLQ
jgi:hypothetical protein